MPDTVARVVQFGAAAGVPLAGPVVEVCAHRAAHYMTYGEAENADVMRRERLLPEGLVEGCRLRRDVPKDRTLTYDDVELPSGRLADKLRAEQEALFG